MNPENIRQTTSYENEKRIHLTNDSPLKVELTQQGHLFAIRNGSTLVNQLLPDSVEQGLGRLWIRIRNEDGSFESFDAIGSETVFDASHNGQAVWRTRFRGKLEVTVTLALHPQEAAWAFQVQLNPIGDEPTLNVEALLVQDVGLSNQTVLRMNEAYNSQYVDMQPLQNEAADSWAVCARQNQADEVGKFPWLIMGCCEGAKHYATDGWQIFGNDYRYTRQSGFERGEDLPSKRLQYEFSAIGLQSQVLSLVPDGSKAITFLGYVLDDHSHASGAEDFKLLKRLEPLDWISDQECSFPDQPKIASIFQTSPLLHGLGANQDRLNHWFPEARRFEETGGPDGSLLSFFYGENAHVVTREKEAHTLRPHGHIMRSGDTNWVDGEHLGVTCYADGMFGAQCFCGNPNLALLYSVRRNALNLQRSSGQRVFIRSEHGWQQLGIPTFFEMTPSRSRWIYCWENRELEILAYCHSEQSSMSLQITVVKGEPCEFIVTNRLVLGSTEGESHGSVKLIKEQGRALLRPAVDMLIRKRVPEVAFSMAVIGFKSLAELGMDELLYENCDSGAVSSRKFLVFKSKLVQRFGVCIHGLSRSSGHLDSEIVDWDQGNPVDPIPFTISHLTHDQRDVGKLEEILPWFNHNAGIHFSSPHGLEQYGGAAWGVRDVCQGSMEWLLASQRYKVARRILIEVFEHQYLESGDWPQWFMHGPFSNIQQKHSHGDICFWPVKALCDYIEASNDFSVLAECVDFTSNRTLEPMEKPESIVEHCDRIFQLFETRLSSGGSLVNYGEGDWDDTLQPADRSMCEKMVSAWTVALSYHVFRQFRDVCKKAGDSVREIRMQEYLSNIASDYRKYLMEDDIVAGFGIREGEKFRLLLHPSDEETGIQYRLLPMIRSILAELFDSREAANHLHLIRNQLLFEDGARLMNQPATYKGGIEQLFKRADSAANVGREIGLMYVHAHIRYAEALAKVGDADGLWRALRVINPILLDEIVSTAEIRQANSFFSSSDADFSDRYEAKEHWDKLRNGTVAVKGGWRIYSSSPGLFLNKVRGWLLGFREHFDDLVIDPVLPLELDGLRVQMELFGKTLQVVYRVQSSHFAPLSIQLNGNAISCERRQFNPYRTGGVCIARDKIDCLLQGDGNQMEIQL